jgi:hypothetical protein
MTPKEKAEELFDKFTFNCMECDNAKISALIAVDEILNARPLEPNYVDWDDCGAAHQYWYEAQKEEALQFWQEVKQEIEKL